MSSEMQCGGDETPGSHGVPGEQHPGYSTGLNSPPHLQWEESSMIMQGIHPTPPPFAAGQDFVTRARAVPSDYAPSWDGSHTLPSPYGLDGDYDGLEDQTRWPQPDLNLPPASSTSVFSPDYAGGYSYGYNTPPPHFNLLEYQYQSYGHPQDGSSVTFDPPYSILHLGTNAFQYPNNIPPQCINPPQYQGQAYGHPQGGSDATQEIAYSPLRYEANVFPCHDGARILPPAATAHMQSDTDTGAYSMVLHDTGPLGDVIPSPPHIGDGETAEPSAEPLPSKTNNTEPGDPSEEEETTTESEQDKAEGNKNNGRRLLGPQEGPIQVTAQFLFGRTGLQVVRQITYQCGNKQKKHPKFGDINFSVEGKEGIKLTDAMDRYFDGPDGRNDFMFTHKDIGSSISLRIIFQGYGVWEKAKQIATMNYRKEKTAITKKKLAEDVARRIQTYLEDLEEAGTPYPIPFKNMFLVRLIHVAQASWQPEIWCFESI